MIHEKNHKEISVKQTTTLGLQWQRLGCISIVLGLSACSALEPEKVDYKSAVKATAALEIPPDLTQLSRDSRYAVPGATVSANSLQAGQSAAPNTTPTAVQTLGDIRIERAGNQRWLVVNRSPDQLWNPVREFWKDSGFVLVQDQADVGIMETDWAENRAKIPQDFIRNALGKVLDSLYSSGERDKFRTRLERTATGGTEIYISHRGMAEVYTNAAKDQTVWQPRATDPELETEFLRRLMVKLGVSQQQAQAVVAAAAPAKPMASVTSANGIPVVQLSEGFDRAWRRVGLTLDRTGFTVEDRDRSQGTYFVRYVDPKIAMQQPSLFDKLLGTTPPDTGPVKYRVTVRSVAESTTVSVSNSAGAPDNSAQAQRILQVIADDLK